MNQETKHYADLTQLESDVKGDPRATLPAEPDALLPPKNFGAGSLNAAEMKAAAEAVAEEWNVGDIILDLYEVKGVLGEGGFGKVYLVHHRGWNIDLAVKTPRLKRQDEAGKENFKNEAETWVNLGLHPHIVSCYYVRDLGGIPRVFAEFVKGGSLSDWIRSGKLYEGGEKEALKKILDVAIQFAWGLAYAHEKGLVHQDVKPANALITNDGTVKVTDFGLAKARGLVSEGGGKESADESVLVESGGMTPAYASPEQASGRPLSRKTDIWSWALSVLEMFAGEMTWMRGEAAQDVLEDYLANGTEYERIPEMPKELADLLGNCFSTNPEDRPKDLLSIATRLQEIYQQETKRAYKREFPKEAKSLADSLNNKAVSLIDLGRKEEALRLWEEALSVQKGHLESTYNRGLVLWRDVEVDDSEVILQLKQAATLSADEEKFKFLHGLINLERGDYESAQTEFNRLKSDEGEFSQVNSLKKLIQGKESVSVKLESTDVKWAGLSGDGNTALIVNANGLVQWWDLESRKCTKSFKAEPGELCDVSDDWKYVYFCRNIFGDPLRSQQEQQNVVGVSELWDAETGQRVRKIETRFYIRGGNNGIARAIRLSPDGKLGLVSSVYHPGIDYVLLINFENRSVLQLPENGRAGALSFNQDSTKILLGGTGFGGTVRAEGANLRIWNMTPAALALSQRVDTRHAENLYGHEHQVDAGCFSPDNSLIASTGKDKTIRVWELKTIPFAGSGGRSNLDRHFYQPKSTFSLNKETSATISISQKNEFCFTDNKIFSLETGRCLRTFDEIKISGTSKDGRYVLYIKDDFLTRVRISPQEFTAPLALSFIATSESSVENQAEFNNLLNLANQAFVANKLADAVRYAKRARTIKGFDKNPEVIELWKKLSVKVPRISLKGSWITSSVEAHHNGVVSVALNEDGTRCLSSSGLTGTLTVGGEVKYWDVASKTCLRTIMQMTDGVSALDLTHDGKKALVGNTANELCESENLNLWDLETGTIQATYRDITPFPIQAACLSPDEKWVMAVNKVTYKPTFVLRLYETQTGQYRGELEGHKKKVNSLHFSRDSKFAVSGSDDQTIKLWNLDSRQCVRTFAGHDHYVKCVRFLGDGEHIASGSADKTIKIWDVKSGRCVWTLKGHKGAVTSIALSRDGRFLLSGSYDNTLRFWDLSNGKCLNTISGHESRPHELAIHITAVALSSDGRTAYSGSSDKAIRIWETDTGHCKKTLSDHEREISQICLSADNTYLLSASRYESSVTLWNAKTGERKYRLVGLSKSGYANSILSGDGKFAAVKNDYDYTGIYDLANGNCLQTLKTGSLSPAFIDNDNKYLLASSDDKTITLWDFSTGQPLKNYEGHSQRITSLKISDDHRLVISGGSDNTTRIFDLKMGNCLCTIKSPYKINSVDITANNRFVLTADTNGQYNLCDLENGTIAVEIKEPTTGLENEKAFFSPDGKYFYTTNGQSIKVWSVNGGQCLHEIPGGIQSQINTFNLSRDGLSLVAGGSDGQVKQWFIDWELEEKDYADWDENARPYLEGYLNRYPTESALQPENLTVLYKELSYVGFGWLKEASVLGEVKRMAAGWVEAPLPRLTNIKLPEPKKDIAPNIAATVSYDEVSTENSTHKEPVYQAASTVVSEPKKTNWVLRAVLTVVILLIIGGIYWRISNMSNLIQVTHTFKIPGKAYFGKTNYSPKNEYLILSSSEYKPNSILVLDLKTGKIANELTGHKEEIDALAISPRDNFFVSTSRDGIIMWDIKTGRQIWKTQFTPLNAKQLKPHEVENFQKIMEIAFTPQGNEVLAKTSWDNSVNVINADDGKLLKIVSCKFVSGNAEPLCSNFSSSQSDHGGNLKSKFNFNYATNYLEIIDQKTEKPIAKISKPCGGSPALTSDGKYIISQCNSSESIIEIYHLKDDDK